jgi:uncharacterized protein (DUF924 family)
MDESILTFWFGDDVEKIPKATVQRWFRTDPAFDQDIAQRFGKLQKAASAGAFEDWKERAKGRLALLILLDQFSRNLNRSSPLAWANDARCQKLAQEGVELGQDKELSTIERIFFYMPMQHSECRDDQDRSVELYADLMEGLSGADHEFARRSLESARYHRELVHTYGRFPHRNAILGRTATAKERVYLDGLPPGKAF